MVDTIIIYMHILARHWHDTGGVVANCKRKRSHGFRPGVALAGLLVTGHVDELAVLLDDNVEVPSCPDMPLMWGCLGSLDLQNEVTNVRTDLHLTEGPHP